MIQLATPIASFLLASNMLAASTLGVAEGLAHGAGGSGGSKGAAPQQALAPIDDLAQIRGVREYSGAVMVRPIQREKAVARGLDALEVEVRSKRALDRLAEFDTYEYIAETDEYMVLVPPGEDDGRFAKRLLESGDYEYAVPDWWVYPLACSNDPSLSTQWHHAKIGSCAAWDFSTGSSAVTVAICDTGVRVSHSELVGRNREGYNAVTRRWESGGGAISDLNGHGTMTTGVAAARGNNAAGGSGVGWNFSYRPIRVSEAVDGTTLVSTLTAAARTAAEAGDKVVSVSYSHVADPTVESTGAYLRSRGSLLFWASGNAAENHTGVRADNVVMVGATDQADMLAPWSGRGQRLDFVAPGVGIYTTTSASNTSHSAVNGTSFATPMAAGVAALIWSRNPSLTPAQVEQILRNSAVDLGAAGPDDTFGYGRLNAAAALAMTTPATRTERWAISVPETSSPASTVPWTNESYAAGSETCDDCNTSACSYSTNSANGNMTPLTVADFENFTLPAGQRIVKVEVEVSGRYNTDTSASIGIRAFAPSHGLDSGWRSTPSFISGTRCAPRAGSVGDITGLSSNWTAAMVNNLQFQVRRQSNLSNNTLRVVSMKLIVTTAPM
jgi:subtilisin family serine protease